MERDYKNWGKNINGDQKTMQQINKRKSWFF
jgi:hypothetical protein